MKQSDRKRSHTRGFTRETKHLHRRLRAKTAVLKHACMRLWKNTCFKEKLILNFYCNYEH